MQIVKNEFSYSQPSEKVLELIEIANLDAKEPVTGYLKLDMSKMPDDELSALNKAREYVEENFENNLKLKNYLLKGATAIDLQNRFENFLHSKQLLSMLVEVSNEYRREIDEVETPFRIEVKKEYDQKVGLSLPSGRQRIWNVFKPKTPPKDLIPKDLIEEYIWRLFKLLNRNDSEFFINKNEHKLSFMYSSLFDEIHRHDIRRFRRCVECKSFFWAYRLDQIYCDKKCSNVRRQKRARSSEIKRRITNARRSKTRYEREVRTAQAVLKKAKSKAAKEKANKRLQSLIDKRTKAAQKLNNLKKEKGK